MNRVFGLFVVWALAFGFMAAVIGLAINAPHLLLLMQQSSQTTGRVTQVMPENHGVIKVTFSVAKRTYELEFSPDGQLLPISEGATVPVYYYPPDPSIAFLAPSSEILVGELPFWIAGSLFFSLFVSGIVFSLWRSTMWSRLFFATVSPRYISTVVVVVILAGIVLSAYFHILTMARFVGEIMGLGGAIVFLRLAWARRMTWAAILRSAEFWIAFCMAVAGNFVDRFFSRA